MLRRPPRTTRPDTLFPYTTLFRASLFVTGLVNAIDFLHSTPDQPYPENQTCAGRYPTAVTAYNPFFDRIDRARLGVAGHSAGAFGASIVQGLDGDGAAPWFGKLDAHNPVKVVVPRSEEPTSELQSLMRISYAVFCLKKKKQNRHT